MKLHQIGLVTNRTALTPAAIEIDNVIRIFAGFVYDDGMSRIHTIDVNPRDPSEVYAVSEEPVLGLGGRGAFDEHGVIPAFVFGEALWYSAFRHTDPCPFEMSIGCAQLGLDYRWRVASMEESPQIMGGLCLHGGYMYYSQGDTFIKLDHLRPMYEIFRMGHPDPILCCEDGEYRIGKPYLWRDLDGHHMLCTAYAQPDSRAYLVHAVSLDELTWYREPPLTITGDVFPSPIYAYRCGEWVFFNGAGNGEGGIGYGRLEE